MSVLKTIDGYMIFMDKILGKGQYGSVYLGKKTKDNSGELVAVKILSKYNIDNDPYLKDALINEIKIIEHIKSEHVVGFYEVMESSKNYYIIQELCDGDIIPLMKPKVGLSYEDSINILKQVCMGFQALVKEGIIHRDLKPANIMRKSGVFKIGDFGFAKQIEAQKKNRMLDTVVGTPLYMPLQILRSEKYTSKCDIWALGFIFYELLHGMVPWTGISEYNLARNIKRSPLNIRRTDLSPNTVDFLKGTLQIYYYDRMSWYDVFRHPIFNGMFVSSGNYFENKLKTIMSNIRFFITSNNLDLSRILLALGYNNSKIEINFNDYFNFLKVAYPYITLEEAEYVFMKTDTDNSKEISIREIELFFAKHGIKLESHESVPVFQGSNDETFLKLNQYASQKIKNCFVKLYNVINKKGYTLIKVFKEFNKSRRVSKDNMTYDDFSQLMKTLSSRKNTESIHEITDEEIKEAFRLIDEDHSNTIEFDYLKKYYLKVNGLVDCYTYSMTSIPSSTPRIKAPETYRIKSPMNHQPSKLAQNESYRYKPSIQPSGGSQISTANNSGYSGYKRKLKPNSSRKIPAYSANELNDQTYNPHSYTNSTEPSLTNNGPSNKNLPRGNANYLPSRPQEHHNAPEKQQTQKYYLTSLENRNSKEQHRKEQNSKEQNSASRKSEESPKYNDNNQVSPTALFNLLKKTLEDKCKNAAN